MCSVIFVRMIKSQEQDEFVAVRVQDPRVQNEGSWNSYVDFKIFLHTNSKVFTAKTSCVRRRYSEFVWLKKRIQKNAGLVPIPDLPSKSYFSFVTEDLIERRRKGLQCFLDKVLHMTVCLSDSQLHLFLQTQLPVGHILDCVQGHTPYTVTEAILTYASSNRGWAQEEEGGTQEPCSTPVSYESVESPPAHLPSLQCEGPLTGATSKTATGHMTDALDLTSVEIRLREADPIVPDTAWGHSQEETAQGGESCVGTVVEVHAQVLTSETDGHEDTTQEEDFLQETTLRGDHVEDTTLAGGDRVEVPLEGVNCVDATLEQENKQGDITNDTHDETIQDGDCHQETSLEKDGVEETTLVEETVGDIIHTEMSREEERSQEATLEEDHVAEAIHEEETQRGHVTTDTHEETIQEGDCNQETPLDEESLGDVANDGEVPNEEVRSEENSQEDSATEDGPMEANQDEGGLEVIPVKEGDSHPDTEGEIHEGAAQEGSGDEEVLPEDIRHQDGDSLSENCHKDMVVEEEEEEEEEENKDFEWTDDNTDTSTLDISDESIEDESELSANYAQEAGSALVFVSKETEEVSNANNDPHMPAYAESEAEEDIIILKEETCEGMDLRADPCHSDTVAVVQAIETVTVQAIDTVAVQAIDAVAIETVAVQAMDTVTINTVAVQAIEKDSETPEVKSQEDTRVITAQESITRSTQM